MECGLQAARESRSNLRVDGGPPPATVQSSDAVAPPCVTEFEDAAAPGRPTDNLPGDGAQGEQADEAMSMLSGDMGAASAACEVDLSVWPGFPSHTHTPMFEQPR